MAVLLSLAQRLGLVELIDAHVERKGKSGRPRRMLSVGQTPVLAAIGRALHPTSKRGWVPLTAKLFRGNHNDMTTFPGALDAITHQCAQLEIVPDQVTVVCDKGNLSKKNWALLDASKLGHVVSLVPSHYKEWTERPLEASDTLNNAQLGEVRFLRGEAQVAGTTRTLVVLDSPTLRDGQLRGLQQQLRKPLFALAHLEHALRTAGRRRRKQVIERQLKRTLRPATIARLITYKLTERNKKPGYWRLEEADSDALDLYNQLTAPAYTLGTTSPAR